MTNEHYKWWSPHLEREMELRVFGARGTRVLFFPTRGGRHDELHQNGIVHSLATHIEHGWVQLFCMDSVDTESFYCFWAEPQGRINRHLQFEKYLIEELIPFSQKLNPSPGLISAGCSLGAFHAVNLAFRHPGLFTKVVGMSGRYDLTLQVENFENLLPDFYNDEVYFNTPTHYLPNLTDPVILGDLRKLDITLVVGRNDPFRENNELLSRILWEKNIWHRFLLQPGRSHRWTAWQEMAPTYL